MDQSTHDVRRTNWLRKFHRETCKQIQLPLPATTIPAEVSFAEFNVPASVPVTFTVVDHAVAAIRANGITLEMADDISEPLLRMLL